MNNFEDSNSQMMIYSQVTESVSIKVLPEYYAEGSAKDQSIFIWHYSVKIENLSNINIQVLGRHWQIFESSGRFEEIKSPGVLGYQPILKPGENFKYTSDVRLFTDSGAMNGEYYVVDLDSGRQFAIKIPPFSLDVNLDKNKAN